MLIGEKRSALQLLLCGGEREQKEREGRRVREWGEGERLNVWKILRTKAVY